MPQRNPSLSGTSGGDYMDVPYSEEERQSLLRDREPSDTPFAQDVDPAEPTSSASMSASFLRDDKLGLTDNPLDKALTEMGFGKYQVLLVITMSMTTFALNSEIVVQGLLEADDNFIAGFHMTPFHFAAWASATALTWGTASAVFGALSDIYGRKWLLLFGLSSYFIVGLMVIFTTNFYQLFMLRLLANIGAGAFIMLNWVLCLEQMPASSRGRVGTMASVFMVTGLIYMSAVGMGFKSCDSGKTCSSLETWKWICIMAAVPSAFVIAIRMMYNLESPRFLLKSGRPEEAYETLVQIAVINGYENPTEILPPLEEFEQYSVDLATTERSLTELDFETKLKFILVEGAYRRTTWGVLIALCCLSAGIGTVNAFAAYIIRDFQHDPYELFLYSRLAAIPTTAIYFWAVDQKVYGRLMPLKVFYGCIAFLIFLLAVDPEHVVTAMTYCGIYACYYPTYNILQLIMTEVYPTQFRATAFGVITCFQYALQVVAIWVFGASEFVKKRDIGWWMVSILVVLGFSGCFLIQRDKTARVLR